MTIVRRAEYSGNALHSHPVPLPSTAAPSLATRVCCLAAILATFLFTRLPFLLDWRLPLAFPDTATYLWPLQDLETSGRPLFDLRTPGYPLFWWLCRRITDSILFVVYAQIAISAATAAIAAWLLARHAPMLLVPVTATLVVFVSGNAHLMWDVTLLSESVFTSAIVAWTLFMFLSLTTQRPMYLVFASSAAASAIAIRPSAIHLAGSMGILAVWMLRQGFGRLRVVLWLLPLGATIVATMLYNRATIGVTALSGGSGWAYMWSTMLYLDPDPRLLPEINEAARAKNTALPPADRETIYRGDDLRAFRAALERNIGTGIAQIADRLTGWPSRTGWRYMEYRQELLRTARTAISQHPRLYALNVVGTFVDTFRFIAVPHPNYYAVFPATDLYRDAFVAPPFYVRNLDDYYNPPRPPGFLVTSDDAGRPQVKGPDSRMAEAYAWFSDWRSLLFENLFWLWVLPVSAAASLVAVVRKQQATPWAVAWFTCLAAVAGNALMAALIGHTEPRYAQPMHFVNYLAAALAVPFFASSRGRS